MAALKCCILLISCLILATASPIEQEANFYEPEETVSYYDDNVPVLSRQVRSPQDGGRLELRYQKDKFGQQSSGTFGRDGQSGSVVYRDDKYGGRTAGGQYNQNLYTSKDGHVSVDAYAGARRNFDHNRNEANGGIKTSIGW